MVTEWFLAVSGSALVLTQSTIVAPFRDWLDMRAQILSAEVAIPASPKAFRIIRRRAALAKLVSCPMCSGFWLGLGWAVAFGARGVSFLAFAFGGSIVSAILVAFWVFLQEAHQALALWRYNNQMGKCQ